MILMLSLSGEIRNNNVTEMSLSLMKLTNFETRLLVNSIPIHHVPI